MSKKAIIIGAGMGGLCTALALQKEGFQVNVFDKAAELSGAGAGIILAANAIRILEELGVAKEVISQGAKVGRAEIRTWNGKLITHLPTEEQANRYGTHSYLIHRSALQSILIDHLSSSTILQLNKKIVGFEQNHEKVTASFADGTVEEGDFLIGSDGIHSAVRERLVGFEQLRYAGYTALRGVCDYRDDYYIPEVGGGFEAWGPGKRFGFSQLGDGKVFWFAAISSPQGIDIPIGKRKLMAQKLFEGWYPPVRKVIDATKEDSILHHDVFDKKPLEHWSKGRVTLLGDAAHPMLPNLGQGGAQAMEDAVELVRCLTNPQNDVPSALLQYEKERKPRTTKIVNQSRKMGRMVQLENPVAMNARNAFLRLAPANTLVSRLDWILGYKG